MTTGPQFGRPEVKVAMICACCGQVRGHPNGIIYAGMDASSISACGGSAILEYTCLYRVVEVLQLDDEECGERLGG
jgi:hypothetical protein